MFAEDKMGCSSSRPVEIDNPRIVLDDSLDEINLSFDMSAHSEVVEESVDSQTVCDVGAQPPPRVPFQQPEANFNSFLESDEESDEESAADYYFSNKLHSSIGSELKFTEL